MKTIVLSVFLLVCAHVLRAQEIADVGKIPLAVIIPDKIADLDQANLSKLETKVLQIVTASGLASAGYTPGFAIIPKFAVIDNNVAEGGMQNLTVITASLTLFIKQIDNDIVISSVTKELKGSGSTTAIAVNNAIAKIAPDDAMYKTFILNSKDKIIAYYDGKCDDLMTLAENMITKQNYEEALGVLMSIPVEAKGCYKKAQLRSVAVYKAYQNKNCSGIIQTAKTKIAATQYNEALELLSQVDPSSTCNKEALDLIKTTASKVSEQQKKEWDLALKIYNDEVALEKYRITAIKEIAIALYKQKGSGKRHSKHGDQ